MEDEAPFCKLLVWVAATAISLVTGLLPSMDNFAHIGGSIAGLLAALVVSPRLYPGEPIWFVRVVGGTMLAMFFFTGFVFFYMAVDMSLYCGWCRLLNCSVYFATCREMYSESTC